jgi:hypothetical protein
MGHIVTDQYTLHSGYDPETDTEYLLTTWVADGYRQLSTRPGDGRTELTWSAPITLTPHETWLS